MKFLLGKKVGMGSVFTDTGRSVPVTVLEVGPIVVTQIKSKEKDGYQAVQVGYGSKKHLTKPVKGHVKNLGNFRWLREYRAEGEEQRDDLKAGTKIDVSVFEEGDRVTITGTSKGKGFQGVVKRHGFAGGPKSHGNKKTLRAPGSIGSQFPQHVLKGKRMGGRMGSRGVTKRGIEIIKIDKENNLMAVKGPIPGARGSLLEIRG